MHKLDGKDGCAIWRCRSTIACVFQDNEMQFKQIHTKHPGELNPYSVPPPPRWQAEADGYSPAKAFALNERNIQTGVVKWIRCMLQTLGAVNLPWASIISRVIRVFGRI